MKYFKVCDDNYIYAIQTGGGGDHEITKEEYDEILSVVKSRPIPEEGFDYKLKADLTWEKVEVEVIPEEDREINDNEALDIILGGDF